MDDGSDYYADDPDAPGGGGGPEPKWSQWLWNIIGVILAIWILSWYLRGCPNTD